MQSFWVISSVLLWGVVLLNLVLTLALVRKVNAGKQMEQGLKPGVWAPNFSAHTLDGKLVSWGNYADQQVAFLFISPHCKPCRDNMSEYQMLYSKAKKAGIELVLVSISGTIEEVQAMVTEYQLTVPLLSSPQETNSFSRDYKVGGTPFYCLVGKNGKVQSSGYASLEAHGEWKELVKMWNGGTE